MSEKVFVDQIEELRTFLSHDTPGTAHRSNNSHRQPPQQQQQQRYQSQQHHQPSPHGYM